LASRANESRWPIPDTIDASAELNAFLDTLDATDEHATRGSVP
jgi:hypothetical protein